MQAINNIMRQEYPQPQRLQLAEPVVIVGLGKTGLSCARFLIACGYDFTVVDSRENPPGRDVLSTMLPADKIITGEFNKETFARAGTLIVSPGVSVQQALMVSARERGANIMGDIELFARVAKAPIVAITGSNGKSTVTTLLAEMLRQANKEVRVGGNLGVPALELLDDTAEFYVLELSSFQLETTQSLDAVVSVILNISEDHMDRYDDLQAYVDAKTRLFSGQGCVVANLDDDAVMQGVNQLGLQRKIISFSLKFPVDDDYGLCPYEGETWLCKGPVMLMPVSQVAIKGTHNIANALAALALGDAIDLPMDAMLSALRTYTGLPHRMQWVAEFEGVNWFNDSKATNVGATVAAIEGVPGGDVILIAGGQAKGQDFTPLGAVLAERVRAVVLIGEDAALLAEVIPESVSVSYAQDMLDAVRQAARDAHQGDAVLLSPACASFDMFSGYEQRGDVYMNAVREVCV